MKKLLMIIQIHLLIISTTYSEKIGKWEQVLERESTANWYYGISAADSLNCMLFGANGSDLYIKKTTDGGNSWMPSFQEYRAGIIYEDAIARIPRHISYTDNKHCFVTIDSGNVLKTNDGGENWIKTHITDENLKRIHMFDSEIGVIGTKKSLFLTKNSWSSWKKVVLPDSLDNNYYFDFYCI